MKSRSAVLPIMAALGLQSLPFAWSGTNTGTLFSQQWDFNNSGQTVCGMDGTCQAGTVGADIHALKAWATASDCSGVLIAVLDTGVDSTHPDLTANIAGGKNFVSGSDPANYSDDNLHGTHVTGTIAANGSVNGICQSAKVLEVKVADSQGRLADSDILAGFNYAVTSGAKVINASWGGPGNSQAFAQAIKDNPETLLVVAAGNDGTDNDSTPTYPANYGYPNIVTVAATDNLDQLASFSNFGATTVDLAAPGVGILSTTPVQPTQEMSDNGISTGHALLDGTSMATPHVTAALALYWSNNPGLSAADVKAKVLNSVDSLDSLSGSIKTGGRLDLAQLVN